MLRLNLWSYPRAFCCTGPTGATSTRLSLRPLIDERVTRDAKRGQFMTRERERTSPPLFDIWIRTRGDAVGWAKRSVPTTASTALEGGHASLCPPYNLKRNHPLALQQLSVVMAPCFRRDDSGARFDG